MTHHSPDSQALVPRNESSTRLAQASRAADSAAARHVFGAYRERLAARTRTAQDDDLARFARYLAELEVVTDAHALANDPVAWQDVSWGIVVAFVQWQVQQGYAVASINRALSTVKVYCTLALQAGALSADSLALIRTVQGYSTRQGKRVDTNRTASRIGHKKAQPTRLTLEHARALKDQPRDTPQGRRDALLVCVLLDHGLRVGEVAALQADAIDLIAGQMVFYREKVDKQQTHKLSADTLRAALAYLQLDQPERGSLFRGSRKDGGLTGGMSTRATQQRIRVLGERVGLEQLSPHDLRHYWATTATRAGTHPFALQEAGGWASLTMPRRYTEAAKVANEGVKLEL